MDTQGFGGKVMIITYCRKCGNFFLTFYSENDRVKQTRARCDCLYGDYNYRSILVDDMILAVWEEKKL